MYTATVAMCATPFKHADRFTMVHSVFARGFNIASKAFLNGREERSFSDHVLLWVGMSENPVVVPCSMQIQNSVGAPVVNPGSKVTYDADGTSLMIGTALKLDLTNASIVDTRLPTGSDLTHPGYVDVLERGLTDHQNLRLQKDSASPSTIVSHVNNHLSAFLCALVLGHAPHGVKHLDNLVGYGCGLTPSGDDALLGSFAFIQVYYPELASMVSPLLRDRLRRTTDVSSSYLSLSLDGYVATQIRDVLSGFRGVRNDRALSDLLSIGHSSGEDIVRGIAIAARSLQPKASV